MTVTIGRRELLAALGGAAAAWPLAARAQQPAMPVVSLVSARVPDASTRHAAAFRKGLSETGYIEGQNVTVEYHWFSGQYDRLPALMADLVHRRVAIIATPGGSPVALAAKAATTTIPIVFGVGEDPVKLGLVASLNRPGGNATGINVVSMELETKRLGLLHELVPTANTIAGLLNPKSPNFATQSRDMQAAARAIRQQIHLFNASNEGEIDAAFAALGKQGVVALAIGADPFFANRREQLVGLAAHYGIPTIYEWRELVVDGGLISYGVSITGAYRQAGSYVGRVLKGEKPADLPVIQPTKFELVINLKTAKALGLDVPDRLLALADEVIE